MKRSFGVCLNFLCQYSFEKNQKTKIGIYNVSLQQWTRPERTIPINRQTIHIIICLINDCCYPFCCLLIEIFPIIFLKNYQWKIQILWIFFWWSYYQSTNEIPWLNKRRFQRSHLLEYYKFVFTFIPCLLLLCLAANFVTHNAASIAN